MNLLAFLSAAGWSAKEEWQHLREAIAAARSNGLPVKARVLVGEEALLKQIREEIKGGLADVEVAPMPATLTEFEREVETSPNILHFFCHGKVEFGTSRLELATALDWRINNKTGSLINMGSLVVPVGNLVNLVPRMPNLWLATFNCCESGKVGDQLNSLAHKLVAGGVPAAIAMLEPIDAMDAYKFSGSFYRALFDKLRLTLRDRSPTEIVDFEWVDVLYSPRTALRDLHEGDAANHREWALPVLYVRTEKFRFRRFKTLAAGPGAADEVPLEALRDMKLRAEIVAESLHALPPRTPDPVRAELLKLLADVPEFMRPNRHGVFSEVAGG